MSVHRAAVRWRCEGDFLTGRYSRVHDVVFDGARLTGSASLHIVPAPYAIAEAVDPEEMFVASVAACHMLWFLDVARQAGISVEAYDDEADALLTKDAEGRLVITLVTLRPRVICDAGPEALERLHHDAHARCFIANSVKSEIVVEPRTVEKA